MNAMTRSWLAFLTAVALSLSGAARAQETFDSLGGTWWFKLGGQDAGAVLIAFTAPHNGAFEVEDLLDPDRPSFGFSSTLGAFFFVDAGQPLTLDSKGNVVGTLNLTDESDVVIGTLAFEKGKPNKKFTGWKIRASLQGEDLPIVAKLSGKRIPQTFPVLSGGNPNASLSGKGVKSKAFDLHVTSDTILGLPAYGFEGEGPVDIDKVETPNTTMAGRFMLSPKFELFGLLEESSAFGTGGVSGKLKLPTNSLVPSLNLVARAERKVTAKAKLTEAVDPVLKVAPTTFDFGALHLDAEADHSFEVSNVGAGILAGEAKFLSGDSADFTIQDGESTYGPLDPNSPAQHIVIVFSPQTRGSKSATFRFDVDGGIVGAQTVTVTGVGGIAHLVVDPNAVDFADTAINTSAIQTITLTNDGDGVLTGSATVTGADFALVPLGQQNPVTGIDYTIDPGDTKQFSLRFRPTAVGDKAGTLTLTGGGGASVALTGTGI